VNLIGKLQLSTEKSSEEDNEAIIHLRVLRVQVSTLPEAVAYSVTLPCCVGKLNNNMKSKSMGAICSHIVGWKFSSH